MRKNIGILAIGIVMLGLAAFLALTQNTLAKEIYTANFGLTERLICAEEAADYRESAIASAFAAFNADINEALNQRRAALREAWGISDFQGRKKTIRNVWKDYDKAESAAREKFAESRKEAWSTFKSAIKECDTETGNESPGWDLVL